MGKIGRVRMWWMAALLLLASPAARAGHPQDLVTYVGGPGAQQFVAIMQLSDGTVLLSGGAAHLDWIPRDVPRVELPHAGISSSTSNRIGFLLHLSADLQRMLRVVHLPADLVTDIRMIKTTNEPGRPTGDLYISGPRQFGDPRADGGAEGYFVARLDGNFVDRAPGTITWAYNVPAAGSYQRDQPWDVGSNGKVVLAAGEPMGRSWGALYRLDGQGRPEVVEKWRFHFGAQGAWHGAASDRPGALYSAISFKTRQRGSLRSWTMQDHQAVEADGNGGTRRGRWPLDLFFAGPYNPDNPRVADDEGPGYTGYSLGPYETAQAAGVVIDRRNNDVYFGLAVQSRLPNQKVDVEPAVVAMRADGSLKWWSRLYSETPDNSPPQQFVDALALDYSQPADQGVLVVLARTYGQAPNNLWRGDRINRPGHPGRAFQSFFGGLADNLFVGWLGKLSTVDGTLLAATYVGEYAEGLRITGSDHLYKDPHLDGWLDHDANLADLANTRLRPQVSVDNLGRVYILGVGRRVITTANAFQKMLKPAQGLSAWSEFVRVYSPDFSTLVYSSLLTGQWNPDTGAGGNNTALTGCWPIDNGVMVAGFHTVDRDGIVEGEPIPIANRPPYGRAEPAGEEAILARLKWE